KRGRQRLAASIREKYPDRIPVRIFTFLLNLESDTYNNFPGLMAAIYLRGTQRRRWFSLHDLQRRQHVWLLLRRRCRGYTYV
ncbi:hypothetical protein GW17_00058327, partial [Ensete ventricosum]